MYSIYLIINKTNGKIYVGRTSQTVERRWAKHVEFAARGKNIHFSNAIRKHGSDAFTKQILSEIATERWANYLERLWILLLDSTNPVRGYNSTLGGEGFSSGDLNPKRMNPKRGSANPSYGVPKTDEQKAKISASLMGKMVGNKNPFYGRKHTDETLRFLKYSQLGVKRGPCADETKEKIRQRMVGRKFSPDTLEKMRAAKVGRKQSSEHVAKAAAARLGKPRGPYKKTSLVSNSGRVS